MVWYIEGMKKVIALLGIVIAIATVAGCAHSVSITIGNPSEANCKKQGGVLRTEKGPVADRSTCVLPDGSSFEEWSQHGR